MNNGFQKFEYFVQVQIFDWTAFIPFLIENCVEKRWKRISRKKMEMKRSFLKV